jgi:hypothetical protein
MDVNVEITEFDESISQRNQPIDFLDYTSNHPCTFILDADAPVATPGRTCRGELMRHQGTCVWLLNELEAAEELRIPSNFNHLTIVRTNRYKVKSPMGSGKTKLAIGLILRSPRPRVKPVYRTSIINRRWVQQERIFPLESIIWPTVIMVRSSIFSQWLDQIAEFSTLRVFQVSDSRSLVTFVTAAMNNLPRLNADWDVILIDYKTISGKTDAITKDLVGIFDVNTKKQKHTVPLIMNVLSRRCFARIIYDDSEYHMRAAVFENAMSCIYLSAKHDYGMKTGSATLRLQKQNGTPQNGFAESIEHSTYVFDQDTFQSMITIEISQSFVTESMILGISDFSSMPTDDGSPGSPRASRISIKMMPPEPEVWLCPVVNAISNVIDIINCICDDTKIMEGINNLSMTSFADIIKTCMAGRFEIYRAAIKILDHYENMDLSFINDLPKPPEGSSFTIDNLKRCEPIIYAWRDINNRISDLIATQKKIVNDEHKLLERIQNNLACAECPICLDSLKNEACGIMRCCNQVMHIKCIMRVIQRRCAHCRAPYAATGAETFVSMRHDTNFSDFAEAKTLSQGMAKIIDRDESFTSTAGEVTDFVSTAVSNKSEELTKLSVLYDIVAGRWELLERHKIALCKRDSIIYDTESDAKTEGRSERLKILVYSSADDTLKKIEVGMPVQHAHLTSSASATFAKIKRFRNAEVASAILANSWRDAAGIDFKTATDVIIMNYVDAPGVVQQMVGRVQRMGRTNRARIWLIAYNNECNLWMRTHCEPLNGQEPPVIKQPKPKAPIVVANVGK